MTTDDFDEDLERRIRLLEDGSQNESILDNLPVRDVVWAVVGIVILSVLLLLWGYGQ